MCSIESAGFYFKLPKCGAICCILQGSSHGISEIYASNIQIELSLDAFSTGSALNQNYIKHIRLKVS